MIINSRTIGRLHGKTTTDTSKYLWQNSEQWNLASQGKITSHLYTVHIFLDYKMHNSHLY